MSMRTIVRVLVAVASVTPAAPLAAQEASWATRAGELKREARAYETASGIAIEAEEGWLAVPENRAVPGGRIIEIHFVRLKSRSDSPRAALFYLAGGPGNGGTGPVREPAALEAWAGALEVSDLILIDQRGVRDGDLRWSWPGPVEPDFFNDGDAARERWRAMSRRAREAFAERGVDLRGYTTEESVADLEALRQALGLDSISLLGFSYGTHLACAYLRRHEGHVQAAVLVGVEGPDHTMKPPLSMDTQFERIARIAAADPGIASRVPNLPALLTRVERKLAAHPMPVTLTDPDSGDRVTLSLGPFGLHLILMADIGDASDLPVFPRLIESLDRDDPLVARWFLRKRLGWGRSVSGMAMMMDAASGASPSRMAMIADQRGRSRFGDVVNFPLADVASLWDPPALPADYRTPVVTDVRTLFISGEYDWNAPPYQAEEVRWGFTNSTHLIVANAGHEQTLFQNPEAGPVIVRFLAGEDVGEARLAYRPLAFIPLEGAASRKGHPAVE